MTKATTNINGGTLYSTYTAIRNRMDKAPTSSKVILNVTGGKITAGKRAIWAQASSADINNPATGEINISGGEIGFIYTSPSAGAVSMTTITGGTVSSFKGESGELTVNGGSITGDITILADDGTSTGKYALKDNVYYEAVAEVWNYQSKAVVGYYATLSDAVAAAKKYYTVVLLKNTEGAGVVIDKSIAIDFDGYTYTLTSGVGSGTITSNGFQLLEGNTINFKNGTIKVADSAAEKFYILIQNYANLTVTNMKLDGTNLDKWSTTTDGDSYVVSNNSGSCALKGETVIISNNDGDKAFALDACKYANYALPVVTIEEGVVIDDVVFSVATAKDINIEAAAYVLNYQSKAVVGYYATLEQAVSKAAKYYTVVLMSDIALTDTIEIDKSITLNLNGKTISQEKACTEAYAMIVIESKGALTITGNGKIELKSTGTPSTAYATNTISNKGSLTVNNGTISNVGSDSQIGYAIDNYNGATLTVKGGEITSSGSSYYDAIRLFCGSNATTVTVTGGHITSIWAQNPSANKASEVNGTVTVKGGQVDVIYYENYTTVKVLKDVVTTVTAYGANSENATSAKSGNYTVYSFINA